MYGPERPNSPPRNWLPCRAQAKSSGPEQQGVLCQAHTALRAQPALAAEIANHRMVQPLSDMPFLKLEVQLTGYSNRWQPACTVNQDAVQAYFARHGGEVIEARQRRRAEQREQRRNPLKQRFLGDWSSVAHEARLEKKQKQAELHLEQERLKANQDTRKKIVFKLWNNYALRVKKNAKLKDTRKKIVSKLWSTLTLKRLVIRCLEGCFCGNS